MKRIENIGKVKSYDVKKLPTLKPEEVKKETIILTGPIGAGKSLISSKMSSMMEIPVISTDILRHCPKDINVLKKRINELINAIEDAGRERIYCNDLEKRAVLDEKIRQLHQELNIVRQQIRCRELLPNLPNYEELGYDKSVFEIEGLDKLGLKEAGLDKVAWHFYEKQYENMLLQELLKQINFPCIIDMGGGIPISLDEDYKKVAKILHDANPELFFKHFDFTKIGFDKIQQMLSGFRNVFELKLPEDYETIMGKAADNSELNQRFIGSGQYSKTATASLCVDRLIVGGKVSTKRLIDLCNDIRHTVETREVKAGVKVVTTV